MYSYEVCAVEFAKNSNLLAICKIIKNIQKFQKYIVNPQILCNNSNK